VRFEKKKSGFCHIEMEECDFNSCRNHHERLYGQKGVV